MAKPVCSAISAGMRGCGDWRTGLADDDARVLDGIARTRRHCSAGCRAWRGSRRRCRESLPATAGRHAIGLGENDIEADGDAAVLRDAGDQIRHRGARPRPLPDFLETLFVDIDDDHRPHGLLARHAAPGTDRTSAAAVLRAAAGRRCAAAPARTGARCTPPAPSRTVAPSAQIVFMIVGFRRPCRLRRPISGWGGTHFDRSVIICAGRRPLFGIMRIFRGTRASAGRAAA